MKKAKQSAPVSKRGRAINLYIRPEDLEHVHSLRLDLMKRGHVASQSQVIRAALRLARAGEALETAFEEIAATDGRLKD